jgi:hypothetical protein
MIEILISQGEMNKKSITDNFDVIWQRISFETGIKSLRQLAVVIDKKQPTISAAKAKGDFPPGWAYLVGKKYGLLTEWIMTGEGPKRLSEGGEMNPLLTDVNEWLNEEEKHKDAEFRILFRQQMIRAFFDYENWVKKRKMSLGSGESGSARKVA